MRRYLYIIFTILLFYTVTGAYSEDRIEQFTRTGQFSLGENWTHYIDTGSTNITIVNNTAFFGNVTTSEAYAYYSDYTLEDVTQISFSFMIDQSMSAKTFSVEFDMVDSQVDGSNDKGIQCFSYATDFFTCMDGAIPTSVLSWGDFVPGYWYNVSYSNINNETFELIINETSYGLFDFNTDHVRYQFMLKGQSAADAYHLHFDNLIFYTGYDTLNVYAYEEYTGYQILAFNTTVNSTNYGTTDGELETTYNLTGGYVYTNTYRQNYSPSPIYHQLNEDLNVSMSFQRDIVVNIIDDSTLSLIDPYCNLNSLYGLTSTTTYNFDSTLDNVLTCSLTGYVPFTYTLVNSTSPLNLTMASSNMTIMFFDQDMSLVSTSGIYSDQEKVVNFTGSVLSVPMTNMSEGRVKIEFNPESNNGSFTQVYEFDNDQETVVRQNLSIIPYDVAKYIKYYIKVTDLGNSPLRNVRVRMYTSPQVLQENTFSNYMNNQVLSDNEGRLTLNVHSFFPTRIVITADGYQPQAYTMRGVVDQYNTYETPKVFKLVDTDSSYFGTFVVVSHKYYSNVTDEIETFIISPDAESVEVYTNFNSTLKELSGDTQDRFYYTLRNGRDFSNLSTNDILFYVVIDNELWGYKTVEYMDTTPAVIGDIPELDPDILKGVLPVILVLASVLASAFVKSSGAGFHTFMLGSIFLLLISPAYAWLSLVAMFYYVARFVRSVVITE